MDWKVLARMSVQFSFYSIPLLLTGVAAALCAWFALRRRQHAEAVTFGLLMLALSWWSFLYALHIWGTDLQTQHLFNRLKYVGVLAVPPLWLVLSLQCAQRQHLLTRRNLIFIFLPPLLLLPIVLTDHLTHLWWTQLWLEDFQGQPVMRSIHGLPYYVHVTIGYAYVVLGLWFYVRLYQRTDRLYRLQAGFMIVAATIPLVANILTQLNLSPLPWGLDPFFFVLAGGILAVSILRYRFLDIVPIARQAIIEQVPEGVIVVDEAQRIVDANPAARSLLGIHGKEIVGLPLHDAIPNGELRTALLEVANGDLAEPRRREVRLSGPDGELALSLSATLLSQGRQEPFGQILLLQDISNMVAAQQELEALYHQAEVERERLALTISTSSDAIALLDARGHVLTSNPAARQILGADRAERFPPALRAIIAQAEMATTVTKAEIEISGQSFAVTASPVAGPGLVLTLHDVTHFRQLARLKDEFVRTISHDLRSPLTSIHGYAQLAQRPELAPETRMEALARIEASARRMSQLIGDLLDLATLEAGVEFDAEPVRMDDLARAAGQDLEGAALAKGLEIRYELAPHPPLRADPRLLAQVWRNLIDNAIKYTPAGTITVRVEATPNQVLCQVSDTGIGIHPADLPYIFDKFYRAKRHGASTANGTGLGLALARTVIEKYLGELWVESEPGVGSTFFFALPLVSHPQPARLTERVLA